jgi:iron complex outermembrane receptor protein
VTNLNLTYRPTGSRFSIALAATNVFNVAGINSRYTDPYGTGQTSQQFIPPRQVIGTVAYAW